MALLLILAVLLPSRMGKPRSPKRETFWASSIALIATGLATWVIFLVPLPRFAFPDHVISRPADFASAVLFAIALAMFLRMYHRTRDALVWGLALSIGINVVAQGIMGFSRQLGDACYDIAHVYKVLGYAVPVLSFAIYQTSTILEVKRMERLLAQEKNRLSVTLRSIGDAVIATDVEGRIVLMNGVAERLTGWPESDAAAQALGRGLPHHQRENPPAMRGPGGEGASIGSRRGPCQSYGPSRQGRNGKEHRRQRRPDSRRGRERRRGRPGVPRRDAERQAEDALRQSEERFRLLVNSVGDYAIFMLDPEGRVASWNVGAQRIKGYGAEEILGRHFSCFYTREDRDAGKPEEELRKAVAEGRFEDEGWRVRKDGSRLWANVVITPVFDDAGILRGFAKVTRDITERKRAEEELRLNEARLQALVQLNQMTGASLQEITDFALESAVALTNSKIGYLAFMNEDETVLTMHSWSKTAMAAVRDHRQADRLSGGHDGAVGRGGAAAEARHHQRLPGPQSAEEGAPGRARQGASPHERPRL